MVIACMLVAFCGNLGLRNVNTEVREMHEQRIVPIRNILTIRADLMEINAVLNRLLFDTDRATQTEQLARLKQLTEKIDAQIRSGGQVSPRSYRWLRRPPRTRGLAS